MTTIPKTIDQSKSNTKNDNLSFDKDDKQSPASADRLHKHTLNYDENSIINSLNCFEQSIKNYSTFLCKFCCRLSFLPKTHLT